MKNTYKLLGLMVVLAVMGFTMMSCVTGTTIGGAADPHGLFTGSGAGLAVSDDAQEIAQYTIWLGWFDAGYAEYAEAVKKAEASGKKITSVVTWYYIFTRVTAYAK